MFITVLTKPGPFKGHVTRDYSKHGNCKRSWRKVFRLIEVGSRVWFGRTRETTKSLVELAGDPTEIRKKQLAN
jgi:hypothetical protein